ncbi:restriction endonuclease subunit S [Bacillus sp. JJ1609]|uniref:restriction endonuclease subunit S n=1 Tax=Bacillus sp. JJ1609 TaxID=3122977 RepID=UPI0030001575
MSYNKFQDISSFNSLPENWELKNFKDVFTDVSSGNVKINKSEYLPEGSFPIIDQGKEMIAGFTNKAETLIKSDPPFIIFGDHTRILKYFDRKFVLGADGVKVLKAKSDYYNTNYLYYFLRNIKIPDTGYNRHFKFLKDLVVPIPPLEIQNKIVEALTEAENILIKRKTIISKLDELIHSTFIDMFGDPVINSKQWEKHTLQSVSSGGKYAIKAGPFGSALKKEFYVAQGYKIYGQEQVIRNDFEYGDYYIDDAKFKELQAYEIKPGDILISLVGTFGKVSVVPDSFQPGIINPRLMKISLNAQKIIPEYFKCMMENESFQNRLKHNSHGGTMGIINVGIMKSIEIPIPPLKLQQKFKSLIWEINKTKEINQLQLNNIDLFFNSLLHQAFTGRLKLKENQVNEHAIKC